MNIFVRWSLNINLIHSILYHLILFLTPVFSPEQLWILNPKRILKRYDVDVKHRLIPKDDTAERDFVDSG